MRSHDSQTTERALNRTWDALIAGRRPDAAAIDPHLVTVLERVHALDAAEGPGADFVERLEARLLPASPEPAAGLPVLPPAMLPAPPRRPDRARTNPRPPRWRRAVHRVSPMLELAAAILLLLLIGSYFASSRILTQSTTIPGGPSFNLYLSAPFTGTDPLKQALSPLDPATLQDLPGQPAISLSDPKANPTWAEWQSASPEIAFAVSGDGSTIAQIEPVWTGLPPVSADTTVIREASSANASTIIIRDARTGAIRQRIAVAGLVEFPILNEDGSRVTVRSQNGQFWVAYDTSSGRQFPLMNLGTAHVEASAVNPAGTRLYVLIGHTATTPYSTSPFPQPSELDVYDLTLGRKIAFAEIQYIPAGIVTYGKTPDGLLIQRDFAPGLAISPDGKTLAIAHAESDAITLLDATTLLKHARTFTPQPATSLVHRLLARLPLAPQSAAAKEEAFDIGRHAVFSADGRTLYVVSHWVRPGQYNAAGGTVLQAIDLASGTITGSQPNLPVGSILPASTRTTLYVFGPTSNGAGYHLLRLNGTTLAAQAARAFNEPRWVILTK